MCYIYAKIIKQIVPTCPVIQKHLHHSDDILLLYDVELLQKFVAKINNNNDFDARLCSNETDVIEKRDDEKEKILRN